MCHHRDRELRTGGYDAHRHVTDMLVQLDRVTPCRAVRQPWPRDGLFPFWRLGHRHAVPEGHRC